MQPGDTVKAGEAVARVGNTGVASGNHCHLELERNGVLLDPMQKLSAPRDETPAKRQRRADDAGLAPDWAGQGVPSAGAQPRAGSRKRALSHVRNG